jgi:RNA polymerase sigma-70 factor (ECF subfamily)
VTALITAYLHRAGAYDYRDSWDDVCQEVLVKLLSSARDGAIRNPHAFVGFVGTVTRNALVDWIRKNKPGAAEAVDLENAERELAALVAELERSDDPDLMIDLERALAELPREQADVLRALYLEGHTYEEAARRLRIPLGTLKRRQTQGLRSLRERMGIDGATRHGSDDRRDPSDPIDDDDTSTS